MAAMPNLAEPAEGTEALRPDARFLRMILGGMIISTLGSGAICGILLKEQAGTESTVPKLAMADTAIVMPDANR
jgi:hypothetical protein